MATMEGGRSLLQPLPVGAEFEETRTDGVCAAPLGQSCLLFHDILSLMYLTSIKHFLMGKKIIIKKKSTQQDFAVRLGERARSTNSQVEMHIPKKYIRKPSQKREFQVL